MHTLTLMSRLPFPFALLSIPEIQHPNRASGRFPPTPDDLPGLAGIPGDIGQVRGDLGHTLSRWRAVR